jgi:hypothetical protein
MPKEPILSLGWLELSCGGGERRTPNSLRASFRYCELTLGRNAGREAMLALCSRGSRRWLATGKQNEKPIPQLFSGESKKWL